MKKQTPIHLERERRERMSQCIVPKWKQQIRQQIGDEEAQEDESRNNITSHQNLNNNTNIVPMCNREVTELTWENGQISMHGLGGNNSNILPKQTTWELGNCNTLESIINPFTNFSPSSSSQKWDQNPMQQQNHDFQVKVNTSTINPPASGGGNWRGDLTPIDASSGGKRGRCDVTESACGSASAAFCRDADATMMTWTSLESERSLKSARTNYDDSLNHDYSVEGERSTKEESCPSQSSARRTRAAAVHNLSERRRRDRINQKMKTLQKLVPNASKTDKASMLDEVIEYLKQLQAQIHMMSNARNMPPMMTPLGMQQQLQMSLMARMGMGMGMGMLDVNNLTRNMPHLFPSLIHAPMPLGGAAPSFVQPSFTMPPVAAPQTQLKPNVDPNFNDAYNTFIAQQSMNMDFLNKMSALYRQQGSQQQSKKPAPGLSDQPNHGQGD